MAHKIVWREKNKEIKMLEWIIKLVEQWNKISQIIWTFWIDKNTFYKKIDENWLREKYNSAKNWLIKKAIKVVNNNLSWDNWKLAIEVLKRKDKKNWWDKQEIEHKWEMNWFWEVKFIWLDWENLSLNKDFDDWKE